MSYDTEQEAFWSGIFGNQYIERNQGEAFYSSNLSFFSRVLQSVEQVDSVLELGSNIGMNLTALRALLPACGISAVEINSQAASILKEKLPEAEVFNQSILEFSSTRQWDLTFTKGVLIHINPDKLSVVYDALYKNSRKYILVAEYYSPSPVVIPYRGFNDRLFKRDFAGELLERFNDLTLVDYGFVYRRDRYFPQDDLNWFLLRKG